MVVALSLLIGVAVVPYRLGLHALHDGTLTIRAARLYGGAQPLFFSPRALRLCVTPQPPELDVVSTNNASLYSGSITLSEGPDWCSIMKRSSLLTIWQRLIHSSIKGVSSLLTCLSEVYKGEKKKQQVEARWKLGVSSM